MYTFFVISNLVFNLSLELLTVFVKMRLKVASELLGFIKISRLELLEIAYQFVYWCTRFGVKQWDFIEISRKTIEFPAKVYEISDI